MFNWFKRWRRLEPVVVRESGEDISLADYEKFVSGLMSPRSVKDFESRISVAGLGLAGEGGEAADLVKKVLYHGLEFDEATQKKFLRELGDIVFYVQFAATHVLGVRLQDVINENHVKLSERYKTGQFTVEEFKAKERAN